VDRRNQDHQCGEALRRAAAAHLARHQTRDEHRRRASEHGGQAEGEDRVAQQRMQCGQHGDGERGVVDEAPVQPVDAVEEVQLVGHVAPGERPVGQKVQRELGERETQEESHGQRRSLRVELHCGPGQRMRNSRAGE
jgi:hypothetical protein